MIKAKKEFGQNFLKDGAVLDKIIQAIPENTANIVEIGPGLGDLTRRLFKFEKLSSYEIDRDLFEILSSEFASEISSGKFTLHLGDALSIWDERGLSDSDYFLVANLPYYVATKMILKAIDDEKCSGFVVMIQKEVAQKFCANAGDKEFSALAILARLRGRCELLFDVSASSFEPPPKVTSSVIKALKSEKSKFASSREYEEFKEFLRVSFVAPRKTLLKNLSTKFDKTTLELIFDKLQISKTIRGHELDITLFLNIFKNLRMNNGRESK